MKPAGVYGLILVLIILLVSWSVLQFRVVPRVTEPTVSAPGFSRLDYDAPPAGSYELQVLGRATDADLLDTSGRQIRLSSLFAERTVVLSFIYSLCSDADGCPLATTVLHQIAGRLKTDSALSGQVRLVTVSFDPGHDTPEVLKAYAEGLQSEIPDWRFLTAESAESLQPVLDAYGQTIKREIDGSGRPLPTISHILRVFLIDRHFRIRNIYSASMLHVDTLYNDIKTLQLETPGDASKPDVSIIPETQAYKAGDDRFEYSSADFRTRSLALSRRTGSATDLYKFWADPPLGLPKPGVMDEYRMTRPSIALGRKLFFDRRLSLNNTISCAMCHIPEQGFTSNEQATSVGFEGSIVRRNAPTILNVGYATRLFHDGREYSLENQVWGPLLAPNEMANPSIGYVLVKLRRLPDYSGKFNEAFARPVSVQTVGAALAHYQRTLNSGGSAFDRWYYSGDATALNQAQIRGFNVFTGKGQCNECHLIGDDHALFSDYQFHNTGVGVRRTSARSVNVQLAPGFNVEVDHSVVKSLGGAVPADLGRYEITRNPDDRWKYRTPTLRNVALTAPYMHDGSFSTLEQVIAFYNAGGGANENLDHRIRRLNLTDQERSDLLAFLLTLNGANNELLIGDAFAASVGDPVGADAR